VELNGAPVLKLNGVKNSVRKGFEKFSAAFRL